MSTILEAIGDYLQAQSEGTLGTSIFLGRMPDTPDACVCVYESAGSLPEMTFGAAGIAIDRPIIQIICRAGRDDYPTARDKATSIRNKLSPLVNTTLSGIKVMRLEPTGSVNPIGPDEKDRPLVSMNFQAMILP